ncbi:MAG: type II restriction endonuclease [Microcystis sp. M53603_WE2]|jgi:hypothetical protein|nr:MULTISPECIES: type II restriction endonuclease [unclassified Microcystis]MCZ8361314.1 hypothetical protein [Microcystis sp. LE19-251.1A]MDJ0529801.1 type II restriction endonuclease [Microcystis sp. M53600_WE12]MDJ0540037.1 type II restriction endonuclease [Microcystis sp. M53603_WE2]MDJ0604524.1 type II restriction endonuclease [Microcystis sp. M53602_WE12]
MTPEHFLQLLQHQTSSFAQTVSTNEGEWIIKGFIDIHKKVYTISIDTKIISKIRLFGLCYAMDGDYKGWNPYIERHLAIFVNCFLSRAN